MSFTPVELGHHVQKARKARGLTQKELADLAGIGKTAMFDLEHGNPGVRLNTLLAVLSELGMTLELNIPGEEDTPSPPPFQTDPVGELPEHLL